MELRYVKKIDFHCDGRFPEEANRMLVSQTLPQDVAFLVCVPFRAASFAMLSPGSKALAPAASLSVHKPSANPLGVAASISINRTSYEFEDIKFLFEFRYKHLI